MLLITHVISFTTLGYLLNKKYENGMKIYLLILITMYIPFLVYLQYTSQAAFLILVGTLLAFTIINNNEKKYKLIYALAFILFGSMLRFVALLYVLPYVGVMVFIKLLKKEFRIKHLSLIILFYIVTICICLAFKIAHTYIYNSHPVYKEYLEYNNARTVIHDYLLNSYSNNVDVFENAGWSMNDYRVMCLFNNADDIVFSKDKLEYIAQNVTIRIPSLRQIFTSTMIIQFVPYIFLLICITFYSIKEKKIENILFILLTFSIHLAFIIFGKINIRTCVVNYVICVIYMIINLNKLEIFNLKK